MDGLSSIASSLAAANVADGVNTSLLRSVNNLAQVQTSLLFASLGIGNSIDTYA